MMSSGGTIGGISKNRIDKNQYKQYISPSIQLTPPHFLLPRSSNTPIFLSCQFTAMFMMASRCNDIFKNIIANHCLIQKHSCLFRLRITSPFLNLKHGSLSFIAKKNNHLEMKSLHWWIEHCNLCENNQPYPLRHRGPKIKMALSLTRLAAIAVVVTIVCTQTCSADELKQLKQLKKAYPDFIKSVGSDSFVWINGERMSLQDKQFRATSDSPSLLEQLNQPKYPINKQVSCKTYIPKTDPGRTRNEAFFEKMYGKRESAVKHNLDTIYWMPKYFGHRYPLKVTRINGVNIKLKHISHQLELLVKKHPEYLKYLNNPGGTFYWRYIKNSHRLSAHSFGIAIDINTSYSNYWIWDTGIKENKINQADVLPYKNRIPCKIVSIFEKNGFIWGGKWQHYDTMHFEYRPELLLK